MNTVGLRTRWIAWTAALLCVLFVLSPVLVMLWNSLFLEGTFSTIAYRDLLQSNRQWLLMGNSLALASITTVASIALGLPLAFLITRTAVPAKVLLSFAFAIPLVAPTYIFALVWAKLLGAPGPITTLLGHQFEMEGLGGSAWVLTLCYYPIVMLSTATALLTSNGSHEEAGRLFVGWWRTLLHISFRQALPGTAIGALLVFVLSLGNFGVPSLLQFQVYALEVYTKFNAFYDMQGATAAALPLLLLSVLALAFVQRIRQASGSTTLSGQRKPMVLLPIGRWRWAVLALAFTALSFSLFIPLAALIVESRGWGAYDNALRTGWPELLQSTGIAAVAATVTLVLGFWTGYVAARLQGGLAITLDWSTLAAFALPGTVLGIGLITLWNQAGWPGLVYTSMGIVVIAWTTRFIVFAHHGLRFAVGQIDPHLEEAAAVSGISWLRGVTHIILPLLWPVLASLWLIVFMFSLSELSTSVLVSPAGITTLTVRIFTLMHYGMNELVAALSVLLFAALLLPLSLLYLLLRKSSGLGHA